MDWFTIIVLAVCVGRASWIIQMLIPLLQVVHILVCTLCVALVITNKSLYLHVGVIYNYSRTELIGSQ